MVMTADLLCQWASCRHDDSHGSDGNGGLVFANWSQGIFMGFMRGEKISPIKLWIQSSNWQFLLAWASGDKSSIDNECTVRYGTYIADSWRRGIGLTSYQDRVLWLQWLLLLMIRISFIFASPCVLSCFHTTSLMAQVMYRQYVGESDLPQIMALVQNELSEPYVIYTFRYFLHQWSVRRGRVTRSYRS